MTDRRSPSWRLGCPPFLTALDGANHVLIAGAGGGFDVFSGIPLAVALWAAGKQVSFASLSFTDLEATRAANTHSTLHRVTADPSDERIASIYFPEWHLAHWLESREQPGVVWAFARSGVSQLRDSYEHLVAEEGVDAMVLIDGGTDSLLCGDESGLGSPIEDATSIIAAAGLDVAIKLLVCAGFGVDSAHGVCHTEVLESIAALQRDGAFLGVASLLPGMPEADAFCEALDAANAAQIHGRSLVANSVAAGVRGEFGAVQTTGQPTEPSTWISPLMSMYWGFDLVAVARRLRYGPDIANSTSQRETWQAITAYRRTIRVPKARTMPI